ncbi:MAG: hypothetical protein QXR60_02730 [Candidatus Nanoarchaeia archaeon]
MRKINFVLVIFFVALPALAMASEEVVKIQGRVMEVDLKNNVLVVNEKSFILNQGTVIKTDRGAPLEVGKLKLNAWVYVEGVKDKASKRYNAGKVYLIPNYISKKDRPLYPFIQ